MENTSQFMRLTESEMLDLWKTVMHLQPVHYDCAIERTDGVDMDSILLTRIRQWYASLLLSAPDDVVPIEDVKDAVKLSVADNGVVTAEVPPQCVRPVEWKLAAWKRSVTLFLQPGVPEAAYLHSEWTRPGVCDPAAVDCGNRFCSSHSQPASNQSSRWRAVWCVLPTAPTLFTPRLFLRCRDGIWGCRYFSNSSNSRDSSYSRFDITLNPLAFLLAL